MKNISFASFVFQENGAYPNSALPLILLKKTIRPGGDIDPSIIERIFHENNWVNSWRNGLFPYHHYHSTAHEALGIYSGWVKAQFGGLGGEIFTVEAGDVVIIPAGVAHKNIKGFKQPT